MVELSFNDKQNGEVVPKAETYDFELPSDALFSRPIGCDAASSSGSNLRSIAIGMGFAPSLVDKVINEKGESLGEDNVDLLVESILAYSGNEKSKSESSYSWDSLSDDEEDAVSHAKKSDVPTKPDPDTFTGVGAELKESLRMMNFSISEIEFAMGKLGENASVDQMVDFIVAAQIAQKYRKKESYNRTDCNEEEDKESDDEMLFRIMDKTLRLLEMGFTENEVSSAFEKCGAEASVDELANSIFRKDEDYPYMGARHGMNGCSYDFSIVKTEDFSGASASQSCHAIREEAPAMKRPKEENFVDYGLSRSDNSNFGENYRGKRPKQEYIDDSNSSLGPILVKRKVDAISPRVETKMSPSIISIKRLDHVVAKSPFFFYGSVVDVSQDNWAKISQFLYGVQPEYVNTQFFSAFSRKEGYVHNIPADGRFHIPPKPPMTIQDAIPSTRKWWPLWDTRKQLSCISSEISGVTHLCERFGRIMAESRGHPSSEQQRDILHHCKAHNLVWVGKHKLEQVEPQQLESILGYPVNHTVCVESSLSDRLQILNHCFQTDTLGYHLSVLKSLYPEGLTVLSFFSGIGGAEVTLHLLGIRLKGVVSIETSEIKRRVLRKWWQSSGQTGELVQLEAVQTLTTSKLEAFDRKFGGFDFLICQNPCVVPSSSRLAGDLGNTPTFDFSLFYEFVRVYQRVRSMAERRR